MDQRKELVRLLVGAMGERAYRPLIEGIADSLIANGVVVSVRCKECRFHESGCPLDTHPYMTPDDGFCYFGKPRIET